MHRELWVKLERLGRTPRDRVQRLRGFGVEEYNVDGVVRSLVRQAEDAVKRAPHREAEFRRELLGALALVYLRETGPRPAFPRPALLLPNQAGGWTPARDLHLAEGYGAHGTLNQALYAHAPDALLASPGALGLPTDFPDPVGLATWIGVHSFPRTVEVEFGQALLTSVRAELSSQSPNSSATTIRSGASTPMSALSKR